MKDAAAPCTKPTEIEFFVVRRLAFRYSLKRSQIVSSIVLEREHTGSNPSTLYKEPPTRPTSEDFLPPMLQASHEGTVKSRGVNSKSG